MSLKDAPIRRQLTRMLLLTSGAVLLLTCAAFFTYEWVTFRQSLLGIYSIRTKIVAVNSTASLAFENEADAREVLSALKADPHVVGACLYDKNGKVFATYPVNLPAADIPAGPGQDGYRFERGHLFAFQPVVQGANKRLGTLYLKSDLGAMYERFRLYGGTALLVILGSLLVAYLLARKLQKKITQPILALAETAQAVSDRRDYSVRADKLAGGELGLLTDAFNQMLTRIHEQNAALSESEGRVRAVLNSAISAVLVMDAHGKIIDWNTRAENLFGWTRSEAMGLQLAETIIPPRYRESHRRGIEHFMATGEGPVLNRLIELSALRRDGSEFPVELSISPLKTGDVVTFCGFITDVTERKRAERALRESQQLLDSIINNSTAVIYVKDPAGRYLLVNRRFEELFHLTPAEILGKTDYDLFTQEQADAFRAVDQRVATVGKVVEAEEVAPLDDGLHTYLSVKFPLFNASGQLDAVCGISTDITERKQTEEERARLLIREREARSEAETLNEFSRTLAAELDLQKLVQRVTDAATKASGAKFGAFFYNSLNEQGESYLLYTLSGAPREAFEKFGNPRATPLFGPTFLGQGIVRIDDVLNDPRYGKNPPHHGMPEGHLPVRSYLAVPVISRSGEVLGGLFLGHPEPGVFTERAGRIVVGIAAQSAIAIDNARLYSQAEKEITGRKQAEIKIRAQLGRLNLLQQITHGIGERQDLQSIFQVVIRSLEDSLPIDFGCVCLYEPTGELLTVTSVGVKSAALAMELALTEQSRIPIDQNGLSRCVSGDLVHEPDISDVKFPFPQRLMRGGLHSFVAAPLLVESKVFGVLIAARREANSFNSPDCEFLRQLSEHVALAAHQAQINSALQQAYNDLRQSQQTILQQERLRALGQMASGIAHDINNAISPVALYTESLLEREPNLSERAREYLTTIQNAIEDVTQTVARMREFYRQREPELTLSPIHFNRLIQQVLDLTRARWNDMPQERGLVIQLQTELAPDLPAVMGAESEIRDAMTNLILNAVDAMPQGGVLTLRTRVVNGPAGDGGRGSVANVVAEVSDTGVGMDEETKRRCLEPFFTTKGERGTGLGLAMVYGMVERHSAELELESESGKGTTMRLIFPVTSEIESPSVRMVTSARPMQRLRILIVDDDPLVIKSLRDTLEGDGHLVTAADGGQAGINAFEAARQRGEPFAVVITDLGMPYVDGRKVSAAIKASSPATPVVLLTGWGQRLVAEGEIPPDVDRVLNKPPKLRELRAALAELVSNSEQPKQP